MIWSLNMIARGNYCWKPFGIVGKQPVVLSWQNFRTKIDKVFEEKEDCS